MPRKPKLSSIESLYAELVDELRAQVKGSKDPETGAHVPPPASLLAVAAKLVQSAGIRPTEDGPLAGKLVSLKEALPLVDVDALSRRF
jgi:hypothetical protein